MNIQENIRESLRSIQSNMLRTVLTALIIAIGITSLVGILTAIDGIQSSVNSSFADLGANTFSVSNYTQDQRRRGGRQQKQFEDINYHQASQFATYFRKDFDANVSLATGVGGAIQVKYQSKKTNPNVRILGADQDYLGIKGYSVSVGRNFNTSDLENSLNVAIVGQEVVNSLFRARRSVEQSHQFHGRAI